MRTRFVFCRRRRDTEGSGNAGEPKSGGWAPSSFEERAAAGEGIRGGDAERSDVGAVTVAIRIFEAAAEAGIATAFC